MPPSVQSVPREYEHPFEVLLSSHEHIAAKLESLRAVAARLGRPGPPDEEAQLAASLVLRYFDGAGRHHHEDEEQDLLPRMRDAAKGDHVSRVDWLIRSTGREHAEMERTWFELRDILETVAHASPVMLAPDIVDRFCGIYATHMLLEEKDLFPLARVLLGPEDLLELGRSMARRRGLV